MNDWATRAGIRFGRWAEGWRWALNVRRARRWREGCCFSQRVAFDNALRPRLQRAGEVIAYPDALYRITIDDLIRAMDATGYPHYWRRYPRRR